MMQLFSGMDYLRIDTANSFGLDKENWDTRINWFKESEGNLESLIKQAEEPALFYASVQAYRKAQRGEPVRHPISLDATASGIQLLACLTGCRKSAELCNVVDAGKRMDAYTAIYHAMLQLAGDGAKIERKQVKQSIMTAFYQSKAVPKRVFGEGLLLQQFYQTVASEAPGAWELNESMASLWDSKALSHDWVLPDGFNVHIKIMDSVTDTIHFLNEPFEISHKVNKAIKEGRSLGANSTHSVDGMVVREMVRRCSYNPAVIAKLKNEIFSRNQSVNRPQDQKVIELWQRGQESGFLSTRILNFLDHQNAGHVDPHRIMQMINTLPKKPFEILTIHDCFKTHAVYGNDLRMQYNRILSEIAGSNLLAYLVKQIAKRDIKVVKYGDISEDVLNANYALS